MFAKKDGKIHFKCHSKSLKRFSIFYRKFSFKRAQWTAQEDHFILDFVKENGSKWSKIALSLENRTEHCIKNRFFSILSKFVEFPQRKIKKEVNYLDSEFLNSIIKKYQANNTEAFKEENGKKKEFELNESLRIANEENSEKNANFFEETKEYSSEGSKIFDFEEEIFNMVNWN